MSCYLENFVFPSENLNTIYFICSYFRTVLAIAGNDYTIIASDTRLSEGFLIHTRESPKIYKLYVYFIYVYVDDSI